MGVWTPGPAASTGDDLFTGDFHDEAANGLAGDDTLIGSYGDDTLVGGAGADWIYAGQTSSGDNDEDGQDKLKGGDGDDHLFNFNSAASSSLLGQGGNDTLRAMAGDFIDAGAGDDVIELAWDPDSEDRWATVRGGEGLDQLVAVGRYLWLTDFSADHGIEQLVGVNLTGPPRVLGVSCKGLVDLSAVELVGIDQLAMSGEDGSTMIGGAGDDRIFVNGAAVVRGGAGDDSMTQCTIGSSVYGDAGDDLFEGGGYMAGGGGNDTFRNVYSGVFNGGGGIDTIWLLGVDGATEGVVFNLTDCANGIKQIIGSRSYVNMDVATGLQSSHFNKADHFTGYRYGDRFSSARGDDTILGMDGNDTLRGGDDEDFLQGGKGADELNGQQDNDRLLGGAGNDVMIGEGGADVLIGGLGNDEFRGGKDQDQFVFNTGDLKKPTVDWISDFGFEGVADIIDLSRVDADNTTAGDQSFSYIGEAAFSGTAGELQVIQTELHRFMARGDVDGDGVFDFSIDISTPTLDVEAEHFVL